MAVKALKFGYRWVAGDGNKIISWEDIWFGPAPLATQFWDLFCICNQVGVAFSEVWDGAEVKLTFRRNFDEEMLDGWYELVGNSMKLFIMMMVMLCSGNMIVRMCTLPNLFMQ